MLHLGSIRETGTPQTNRVVVSVGAVGAFAPTVFEDYCIYPYEVLEFTLMIERRA